MDGISINSEIVNRFINARKIVGPVNAINLRTGPIVPPQAFEVDSDFTNSRRIKTQFDGSIGYSSTNFASKLVGRLENKSASEESSR